MLASTTGDLIGELVPFVLLVVFWWVLSRRLKTDKSFGQGALVEKLEEIRVEIRRLREAIENDANRR